MRDSQNNYNTAADVFDGWRDDVLTGSPPTFYPIASAGALNPTAGAATTNGTPDGETVAQCGADTGR